MTEKMSGYGRRWKKWLWIYLAAGAVAYLVVYLVFFHQGGGVIRLRILTLEGVLEASRAR